MKTFEDVQKDPKFATLSPEAQSVVLDKVKPGFSNLSPEAKQIVIQQLTQPMGYENTASLESVGLRGQVQQNVGEPPQPPVVVGEGEIRAPQFTPLQRAGNILGGLVGGVVKGFVPVDNLTNPLNPRVPLDSYRFDPAGQTAETVTRIPSSIIANVLGAIATGGVYNAAWRGAQVSSQSNDAIDQAYRSGNYEAAKNIEDAYLPAGLYGMAEGYGLSKLPAAFGKNIPGRVTTGAGLGYLQDVEGRALDQYAQTGKLDPSQLDYTPGLGALLGGAMGSAPAWLPALLRGRVQNIDDGDRPGGGGSGRPIGLRQVEQSNPLPDPRVEAAARKAAEDATHQQSQQMAEEALNNWMRRQAIERNIADEKTQRMQGVNNRNQKRALEARLSARNQNRQAAQSAQNLPSADILGLPTSPVRKPINADTPSQRFQARAQKTRELQGTKQDAQAQKEQAQQNAAEEQRMREWYSDNEARRNAETNTRAVEAEVNNRSQASNLKDKKVQKTIPTQREKYDRRYGGQKKSPDPKQPPETTPPKSPKKQPTPEQPVETPPVEETSPTLKGRVERVQEPQATVRYKVQPPRPKKPDAKPEIKPTSKHAQSQRELDDIKTALGAVTEVPSLNGGEMPFTDFLEAIGLKYYPLKAKKQSAGKEYRILIPKKGWKTFTEKDTVMSATKTGKFPLDTLATMAYNKGLTFESLKPMIDDITSTDVDDIWKQGGGFEALFDVISRRGENAANTQLNAHYEAGQAQYDTVQASLRKMVYATKITELDNIVDDLERQYNEGKLDLLSTDDWGRIWAEHAKNAEKITARKRRIRSGDIRQNANIVGKTETTGPPVKESPSQRQAREAKKSRKTRQTEEQSGRVYVGFLGGKPSPVPVKSSQAFKGTTPDLVGSTRKEATIPEQVSQWVKDKFSYLHRVRNQKFDINGQERDGNRFVAEVDRLRAALNKGYQDAELTVRNALEVLDDSPGYKASDKLKDVTQYILYADYLRRAQEGMKVPGDIPLKDLQKGFREIQAHIRKHPELRKAALNVRALLTEIGQDLVQAGIIEKTRRQYYPHQVLEHLSDMYGLPVKVKTPFRGYGKQAKGSTKDIETDLVRALDEHLKAINRHNAIDDFIKRTTTYYADTTWKQGKPLPDGFAEYQPRSGNHYFQAFKVPEKAVMDAIIQKLFTTNPDPEVKAALSKVRTVLAVGAPRISYALPEEVVHYLNKLYEPNWLEGNNNLFTKINQTWKGLVTANPLNPGVIGFHFKNAIGDFEAALRDDPGLRHYIMQAMREMSEANRGNPSARFLSAEEWGTIGAGYYGTDMDLQSLDRSWRQRFGTSLKDKALSRLPAWPGKIGRAVITIGEAREDVLRYAKFLKDTDLGLKPWQAHIENGRTFINYNHLTAFERNVLRDGLLPFYTFYKANAVNWTQALTGQRGKKTAARAYFYAAALPLAAAAWNQITDPETEDLIQSRDSKRYLANQLHINTPYTDHNGNKIVIILPTASNAALQLFGLAKMPYRISKALGDIYAGKATMTDALKTQITAALQQDAFVGIGKDDAVPVPRPAAEMLELLNPYLKEVAQQVFDYDLYQGRPITLAGENVPDGENAKRRLEHLGQVVAPPFSRFERILNPKQDKNIAILNFLTSSVKAPDLYTITDLNREQKALQAEARRIKSPTLRKLHEQARDAMFAETQMAVYGTTIDGQRYGKAFNPEQRERVKNLLTKSAGDGGLSYSATAKFGLLKVIKSLDDAQNDPNLPAAKRAQIARIQAALPKYLQRLQALGEKRVRAAVLAVRTTDDPKKQREIFKRLSSEDPRADRILNNPTLSVKPAS